MNEEEKKQFEDYMRGSSVQPPGGSVFDDL